VQKHLPQEESPSKMIVMAMKMMMMMMVQGPKAGMSESGI